MWLILEALDFLVEFVEAVHALLTWLREQFRKLVDRWTDKPAAKD